MKRYEAFDPCVEVSGEFFALALAGAPYDVAEALMVKHYLPQVDPQRWYPQTLLMELFSRLNATYLNTFAMIKMGMHIIERTNLPDSIVPGEFLLDVDALYQYWHQRGNAGYIYTDVAQGNYLQVVSRTPYPDDFLYGVLYALTRRSLPAGTDYQVTIERALTPRDQGGEKTLFYIMW